MLTSGISRPVRHLPLIVLLAAGAALGQSYSVEGANQYVAAKNWNALLRYSQGWTAAEPNNATAWYYLGNTYAIGLNDYAHASPAFERAATLNPKWGPAWNALGCTYAQQNLFTQAAPAFQRAVDANPRNPTYWNNMAATYSQLKKFQTAIDLLNRAENYSGPYANAHNWYVFGNAYSNLRQDAKGIEAYNKALGMNPRFAEAYNNRGVAEEDAGDWDAALADYKRALALGDSLSAKNVENLQSALQYARATAAAGTNAAAYMARVQNYVNNHPGVSHSEAAWRVQQGY